jgi:hypothetical protein
VAYHRISERGAKPTAERGRGLSGLPYHRHFGGTVWLRLESGLYLLDHLLVGGEDASLFGADHHAVYRDGEDAPAAFDDFRVNVEFACEDFYRTGSFGCVASRGAIGDGNL